MPASAAMARRRRGARQASAPRAPKPWHSIDADAVAGFLHSDSHGGLTADEAARRLAAYGANEIPAADEHGLVAIVAKQFGDFLILLLIAAAVIAGLLGEGTDTIAIVVIVLLNAAVGASQEYRAQRAIAALRRMAAPDAKVVRDGDSMTVPAASLVPGDLVELEAGDIVPADLRLVDTLELNADESALTGESLTVLKNPQTLAADAALGDRRNMAYKSTAITRGKGSGLVVGSGLQTEIGRIAELLASAEKLRTPLQQRLAVFGRRLAIAALAICALIFGIGILNGQPPLLMFLTAVSLAVAAVPEALPAIVTASLAIGAKKLSRLNSLVRHLPAVETLGSVTFICADKTGTLTENRMSLTALNIGGRSFDALPAVDEPLRRHIGRALALCNDVTANNRSSDPTEFALFVAAADAGYDKRALLSQLPKVAEFPFDAERKRMTTVHRLDSGAVAFSKGAPEQILDCCERAIAPGGGAAALDRHAALEDARALAGKGYRVLALAKRSLADRQAMLTVEAVESDMDFLGLVALTDPLRPEVAQAVADCLSAGITPVMITGDHPATATRIATQLGLANGDAETLTGPALGAMSDEDLVSHVQRVRVYARVSPEQKIRIVKALQQDGEIVAMTGDGVNDAPALKQASIGVAMGRRGTDVAREAADLLLLDDNFATIVAAVHEGRRVYDNIGKFIKYIVPSNFGEILVLFLAPLLGLPIPLLPVQILWINLITDGLPGLAFSAEPAESNVMRRPPRDPSTSLLDGGVWQHMLWVGLLIGALSLGTALVAPAGNVPHWQSMVFTTLVVAQLFQALAVRSNTESLFTIGVLSNPYMFGAIVLSFAAQLAVLYVPPLAAVFATTPLPAKDLLICVGLGAVVLPAVELEKWLARRGFSYR